MSYSAGLTVVAVGQAQAQVTQGQIQALPAAAAPGQVPGQQVQLPNNNAQQLPPQQQQQVPAAAPAFHPHAGHTLAVAFDDDNPHFTHLKAIKAAYNW